MNQTLYEQYRSLKTAHQQAVLLLQVRDFYQAFDADAQTVATITRHPCHHITIAAGRVDTCCVPAATVDSAIEALLQHGHKVALAEPVNAAEAGQRIERVTTDGGLVREVSA